MLSVSKTQLRLGFPFVALIHQRRNPVFDRPTRLGGKTVAAKLARCETIVELALYLEPMPNQALIKLMQSRIPNLMAVYAFGSRVSGDANANSDWDLAVLVAGYVEPGVLWELSGTLADVTSTEVDLIDLRAASTVMQHQVLTLGERWWLCAGSATQVGVWEAAMLSEMTELNAARAGRLADIATSGVIYGR